MILNDEIMQRFQENLDAAIKADEPEPTAMTLSTVSAAGRVSGRVVLLKGHDENGFVFYTNTESSKGQQLAECQQAALTFLWKNIARQVRLEGQTKPVSDAEADEYFASRPRGSQIGAWASLQSQPLDSRETLQQRVAELEQRYEGQEVPRPPHWSGYRLEADRVEFWYGRDFRLHDRFAFHWQDGDWKKQRLYP